VSPLIGAEARYGCESNREVNQAGYPQANFGDERLRLVAGSHIGVIWRRLKLIDTPAMTKDETSKYTLLTPDGKALQFWSSDGSEASTQQ